MHFLTASLFHLLLTLALGAARGTFGGHGTASHETLTSTGKGRVCQPGGVKGYHSLECESVRKNGQKVVGTTHEEPPGPIAYKSGKDNAAPGPVYNVPHPLGQTLGLEILSSSFQFLAIGTVNVGRTTDALEPELDKQGGERQEKVCPE